MVFAHYHKNYLSQRLYFLHVDWSNKDMTSIDIGVIR